MPKWPSWENNASYPEQLHVFNYRAIEEMLVPVYSHQKQQQQKQIHQVYDTIASNNININTVIYYLQVSRIC